MVAAMLDQDSRPAAWDLLCEWTESTSLRRHSLAVAELWGQTGLLHDLDYARFPDIDAADGHPRTAMRVLTELGYPEEMVRAIGSHADFMGIPRQTPMEKALFAVDELSGFVLAVAYVRPEGLAGMTPKSVRKKMKSTGFAAAVSRDDLTQGAAEIGVGFDEHVSFVIDALRAQSEVLLPPR
jgi:predicted hydrolase (HD superfamily)